MGVDADSVACRDSTSKAENPCQCGRRQAAPGACPPRSCQASSPPKPSPPWAAGRTAGKSQTTVRRTHLGCCGEPGQQSHSSWGTSAALACCFPAGGRVPGVGEEEYPERRSHGISSPPPPPHQARSGAPLPGRMESHGRDPTPHASSLFVLIRSEVPCLSTVLCFFSFPSSWPLESYRHPPSAFTELVLTL